MQRHSQHRGTADQHTNAGAQSSPFLPIPERAINFAFPMIFGHIAGEFPQYNPKPPLNQPYFYQSVPPVGQTALDDLLTYIPDGDSRGRNTR